MMHTQGSASMRCSTRVSNCSRPVMCTAPLSTRVISRQPRMRMVVRTAGPSPTAGDSVESVISLPLFPLPNVLHPAQAGTLYVYEPRYLALFRDLQATAAEGVELKFGHILAARSAPPALMAEAVGGLPSTGVCATVKAVEELGTGKLQVTYQGWRRFKLLTVDHDTKPYPMAAATWLDDDSSSSLTPEQQQLTDQLEQQVYDLLQNVAKYVKQLETPQGSSSRSSSSAAGSSSGSSRRSGVLPDSVLLYAPPPPKQKRSTSADYLVKAGGATGSRIATWQRMGSVYGEPAHRKKTVQDPYQAARDQLGKDRRQELFSFAAASVLELGLPEKLALLQSRDTAARLAFVAAAVQPFLADLVARVSVKQVMQK